MKHKHISKLVLVAAFWLFSCADVERNSPYDSDGINYGGKDPVKALGKGNDIANYRTVQIGEQVWMAENLDYRVLFSRCYDNKESNCKTYGRLYTWATAMNLPIICNKISCSSQISANHRGICPEGWHIPSKEDWDELVRAVGSLGRNLKAVSGWKQNGSGEDRYGFSALPGGRGNPAGGSSMVDPYISTFNDVGERGTWLSSSEYSDVFAYDRNMTYYEVNAINRGYIRKLDLFSVRCVMD